MTRGVGNNPNSISSVGRIDGTSRNNKRLDFKAEAFQVSTHTFECHTDETRNVFTQEKNGLCFVNNAKHFRPEIPLVILSLLLSGKGEGLTWPACGNEISGNCSAIQFRDVAIVGNSWEVLCQQFAAIGVNF